MTRYERDAQDYLEDAQISVLVSEKKTDSKNCLRKKFGPSADKFSQKKEKWYSRINDFNLYEQTEMRPKSVM